MITERNGPARVPVEIRDFADHLHLGTGFEDDGAQDAMLEMYLRAATSAVEARIGKALISRSLRMVLTSWRNDAQGVPIAPVVSLSEVRAIDAAGNARVIVGVKLRVDAHRPVLLGTVNVPTNGQIEVDFEAGYGPEPADVPADLRHAVMLLAASYYENRSGGQEHWPFGVLALLDAHRPVRL